MRTVAIIQARLGSRRLPGKVAMDLGGRPLITHVVERALAIEGLDQVLLNVPLKDHDQIEYVLKRSFEWRPGLRFRLVGVRDQEDDVLGSYLTLAEEFSADAVMRLTGDCPLLDPHLCAQVLDLYKAIDHWHHLSAVGAYVANDTTRSGYPDGTDCEVFSIIALRLAHKQAQTPFEREHVTVWMRRHLPTFGLLSPYGTDLSARKWSVDAAEDLERARAIYKHLQAGQFGWLETMKAEDKQWAI